MPQHLGVTGYWPVAVAEREDMPGREHDELVFGSRQVGLWSGSGPLHARMAVEPDGPSSSRTRTRTRTLILTRTQFLSRPAVSVMISLPTRRPCLWVPVLGGLARGRDNCPRLATLWTEIQQIGQWIGWMTDGV